MKIGIGILGGSGYGAGELLRLLTMHQFAEVVSVVSRSNAGVPVANVHSHLKSVCNLSFDESLNFESLSQYEKSIVFCSVPHGVAADVISNVAKNNPSVSIIDLSADFRLKNKNQHSLHYPNTPFLDGLRSKFVYGLSELNKEAITNAKYVANPGCLATACSLAVAPLVVGSKEKQEIVFDLKTGTSGAGRATSEIMHHPKRSGDFSAYKVLEHRHEPEVLEALGGLESDRINSFFVPHLIPTSRGIFVTAYLTLKDEVSTERLIKNYRTFYNQASFIRVREGSPNLNSVVSSNFCDVSVVARGKQVVCMATLDNLVKGMAGQAIQNMNLLCGLDERMGLWSAGLGPA